MHYKEWSSDTFWLPQSGLCLLPPGTGILLCICIILFTFPKFTGDVIVAQKPKGVCPFYDLDYLKKLESTVKKASAYLDKANASSWWNSWIYEAA